MWVVFEPILAALSRLIFSRAGQWVISILLFLGIGFATKEFAVDPLLDFVGDYFVGLPGDAARWAGYLNLDIYVVAVISAYAAAAIKNVVLRRIGA